MSNDSLEILEAKLAAEAYEAVNDWSDNTERTQQDANFIVGVSNIGHCSEKVRRMLNREPMTKQIDKLAAFNGTWIGEGIEQAVKAKWPTAIIQSTVSLDLHTDQGDFNLTGHPDIILPQDGILLDVKSTDGLAKVTAYKLFETDLQKRFQRHGYGFAAWKDGLFGDIAAEDVLVGNLWIDRGGTDHEFIVRLEPLDTNVIAEMEEWISNVVYAFVNKIEAPKEPSRSFCANWCEYFDTCRAGDTDAEGLIEDPDADMAAALYQEGMALEKEGKRLKDQAKADLRGLNGSTGKYIIRWVEVGETLVPESRRRGYTRLDLSKVK